MSAPDLGERSAIYHGNLFEVLPTLGENIADAMATDPPYGIGYQGRDWDTFSPEVANDRRVTLRTSDTATTNPNLKGRQRSPASSPSAIEYDRSLSGQRGFQSFCEQWGREALRVLKPGAYGLVCGAPRSAHRLVSGLEDAGFEIRDTISDLFVHAPIEFEALYDSLSVVQRDHFARLLAQFDGHLAWIFGQGDPKSKNVGGRGTALKPSNEPIALIRKPLIGTIEENDAAFGTGLMNLRDCEIEDKRLAASHAAAGNGRNGRWPMNVITDETVEKLLSRRFFFVPKPSRAERDKGLYSMPVPGGEMTGRKEGSAGVKNRRAGAGRTGKGRNYHPTVKPIDLMRYLVKLVTPPGGIVLDPFAGSFTTAVACVHEAREYIAIEQRAEFVDLGRRRINAVAPLLHDAFRK